MSSNGTGGNCIRLEPGELTVFLHYGRHLKNGDWIGEQDPYVTVKIGDVSYKSNVHYNGGRDPVWNQQFVFKIDQETRMELDVYDYDSFKKDDCLGKAKVDIVSVRHAPGRTLSMEMPVFGHISHRQHGHVYITLSFRPDTGASTAVSSKGSDASTYALHEREAEAARAYAAAVAVENAVRVANGVGSGITGNGASAASAHTPAAGSSLASGLVGPGEVPDSFQSYEPQGGLIMPHPDRLLPCHQGIVSGSDTSQAMARANDPAGSGRPEGEDVLPPSSSSQYPVIHAQPYNVGDNLRAPAGDGHPALEAQTTTSSMPHPEAGAAPYSVPYAQQQPLPQMYSHPTYSSAYPMAAVGYHAQPAAPPYYPPPPQVLYSMPPPQYPAPQESEPTFAASYGAYPSAPPPPPYGAQPMPPSGYYH